MSKLFPVGSCWSVTDAEYRTVFQIMEGHSPTGEVWGAQVVFDLKDRGIRLSGVSIYPDEQYKAEPITEDQFNAVWSLSIW